MPDTPIDPREEEAFRAELAALGYDSKDFQVQYRRKAVHVRAPNDAAAPPPMESVLVLRTSTRTGQTYEGGHGKDWTVKAIEDLKKEAFGAK